MFNTPNLTCFGDGEARQLQSCCTSDEYLLKWSSHQCYLNSSSRVSDTSRLASQNYQQFNQTTVEHQPTKRTLSLSEFNRSNAKVRNSFFFFGKMQRYQIYFLPVYSFNFRLYFFEKILAIPSFRSCKQLFEFYYGCGTWKSHFSNLSFLFVTATNIFQNLEYHSIA